MTQITVKCNRIQYEKRLSDHLHNCKGLEAANRRWHLIHRSNIDRFDYICRLKPTAVKIY